MQKELPPEVTAHLSAIGARGGKASRRGITAEQSRMMLAAKKAKRLKCRKILKRSKDKGEPINMKQARRLYEVRQWEITAGLQ